MKKTTLKLTYLATIIMGIALIICNLLKMCPEPTLETGASIANFLAVLIAFGPIIGVGLVMLGLGGLLFDK